VPGSNRILHVGRRLITTGGRLGVPAAVFDDLRIARHALLGRGGAGRREGLRVGRIWVPRIYYIAATLAPL
jgi:hypothetical protein